MDIIAKARELAEAISASGEMADFKKYEALLETDKQAAKLLDDYQALLFEISRAHEKNRGRLHLESKMEGLRVKLEEIRRCEAARDYLEAKERFDRLIKNINEVITFRMTGEEPCGSGSCGGCGTGSCSGGSCGTGGANFLQE